MELKDGLEHTEVGRTPRDWNIKLLEEVADCLDSLRVPFNDGQRGKIQGEYPYCGANGILDHIDRYCVDDSVILIAEDGGYFDEYASRPIAYQMSGKFWVNNHAHILKAKSGISQGYLFYALVHKNILAFLASGTRSKLNKSEMNKLPILLPPTKAEQEAIAEALSDADAFIESLERLLEKKNAIKQGAMQQLLTGKRRLPGFEVKKEYRQTEVGMLPADWNIQHLGKVSNIGTGHKDVNEGNPSGSFPFFTCSRAHTFSDSYSFDTEAILVAGNGDVGNLHYYHGKFEAYQRTYVIQDVTLPVAFLWWQLNYKLVDSLGVGKIGSSIPYIKMENLTEFAFGVPSDPAEQEAIATVLSDSDSEIAMLEAKLAKAGHIRQGMMQNLLTGKIRLV